MQTITREHRDHFGGQYNNNGKANSTAYLSQNPIFTVAIKVERFFQFFGRVPRLRRNTHWQG